MDKVELKKTINEGLTKVARAFKKFAKGAANAYNRMKEWIGTDGLLNLETCVVFVGIFNIVMDGILAGIITLIIAVVKSCYDKYKSGSNDEFHDFICCLIGVMIGIVLSAINTCLN